MQLRTPLLVLVTLGACASVETEDPFAGSWTMVSHMAGNPIDATMTLERGDDGSLAGSWTSQGSNMVLASIEEDGDAITFDREVPGGSILHFTGKRTGDSIEGEWTGPFGEIPVEGVRDEVVATDEQGRRFHDRPIVEEGGRTLLWANDEEWFDVTDSAIDPARFRHGIGKDTIPSIDEPEFARFEDLRVTTAGITRETPVIGVVLEGEARAYPVDVMDRHEIVNDVFSGEAYAVLW